MIWVVFGNFSNKKIMEVCVQTLNFRCMNFLKVILWPWFSALMVLEWFYVEITQRGLIASFNRVQAACCFGVGALVKQDPIFPLCLCKFALKCFGKSVWAEHNKFVRTSKAQSCRVYHSQHFWFISILSVFLNFHFITFNDDRIVLGNEGQCIRLTA